LCAAVGFAVIVANEEEAITVCDKLAPEHLEVHTANAAELSRKLNHYGALFVGNNSAEVFGDYGAGPNHTLPTSTPFSLFILFIYFYCYYSENWFI
jgi:phosphoribosyl-ATP pyrophosphohydrolase/phosphoribosyl-AMP cyclohydrolase/histidinol dehydrogenase